MAISPITTYYGVQNYSRVLSDYRFVRKKFSPESKSKATLDIKKTDKSIFTYNTSRKISDITDTVTNNKLEKIKNERASKITNALPVVGRVKTGVEQIKEKDYLAGAGALSLALLYGPEDIREVYSAYNQIKSFLKGKEFQYYYNYKAAQHPFSFFRGTPVQPLVNPFSKKCLNRKVGSWLINHDVSLFDTKVGDWLCKNFKIDVEKLQTNIHHTTYTKNTPNMVDAYKFISKSELGKLTARAMTRTPVITLAVNGGLELSSAIKDIKNGENFFVSIEKSLAKTTTSTAITAFSGAIGSKYGPVGGLIGSTFGMLISNKVNTVINQDNF